jgi:hypothetical protein
MRILSKLARLVIGDQTESGADEAGEPQVLVFFALLMESIQRFEWSLKTLAIQNDESIDGLGFDEAWKRALKTMRRPIGPLEDQVPTGLAEEVGKLRILRNKVAHEILLVWRLEIGLGRVDHATVAEGMFETAERFDAARAAVDALAEHHLRAQGIDLAELGLEDAELGKILRQADEEGD